MSSAPTRPDAKGMQVIGLGLGRTGTGSTKAALDILGYKTLHKIDDGSATRPDWDALFDKHSFTATQDFPTCMFPQELLKAYPNAKFILTVRDAEKWKRSTEETIFLSQKNSIYYLSRLLTERGVKIQAISDRIWQSFFDGKFLSEGATRFDAHTALVKAIIPPSQLLVVDVTSGVGWGPLCEFLGKPYVPFPRENEGAAMKESFAEWDRHLQRQFLTLALKWSTVISAVVGVILGRSRIARWIGKAGL
ncbi:hypothetical protein RQP46_006582 [Phenoliferia psychrophenolica]